MRILCFREGLDMAKRVSSTTCFLDARQSLSLQLVSDDPKQVEMDAVKRLLEVAAARRK